jgi:GT2 family glycosyltransferase
VWGSKIRFYEPADEIWFAGGHITFWGIPVSDGEGERDQPGRFAGVGETQLVSGCVMLLPRRILEQVGGQDDRYYFAIDDIEYSTRIGKAGFKRMMALDAVVRHKVSRTLRKKRPLNVYYITRNLLRWRLEHFGGWSNLRFVMWYVPRWSAEVLARALYGQAAVSRGMWRGAVDFARGVFGECPHSWLNPSYRDVGFRPWQWTGSHLAGAGQAGSQADPRGVASPSAAPRG